jgi:hypothetical protein
MERVIGAAVSECVRFTAALEAWLGREAGYFRAEVWRGRNAEWAGDVSKAVLKHAHSKASHRVLAIRVMKGQRDYATISRATRPLTLVRRKSRPAYL